MTDITYIMSSWIAPPLAAEYLNVSEDEIRRKIHSGELPVCWAGEFMFVDINPDAPAAGAAKSLCLSDAHDPDAPDRIWSLSRHQAATRRHKPRKAA